MCVSVEDLTLFVKDTWSKEFLVVKIIKNLIAFLNVHGFYTYTDILTVVFYVIL